MGRPVRLTLSLVLLVAVLAVMAFPGVVFPHPATNDAIWLANAEWPLLLLEAAGAVAAYAVLRGDVGATIRAALGVLFVGAAIGLVVGLVVFGNLSNDRFGALLFFPAVLAAVGLGGIVVALGLGSGHRPRLLRGVVYGLALAVFFGGWTLVRGATAWLQAPYGFDLLVLLGALEVGVVLLGTGPRLKKSSGG